MKKLILFGNGKIADVIFYYFDNDSEYEVAAFTCDQKYINTPEFNGRPVIPFEEIVSTNCLRCPLCCSVSNSIVKIYVPQK